MDLGITLEMKIGNETKICDVHCKTNDIKCYCFLSLESKLCK